MRRRILTTRLLPSRPHARPGSGKFELTLECGHVTWRARSEIIRDDGQMVESLLCRKCTRKGKEATLDFGQALKLLKAGKAVAREDWDGKGMFLLLIPGSTFQVAEGRPMAKHFPVGQEVQYHGHIDMKTAHGTVVPWVATQPDVLAEDWIEVQTKQ